VDWGGAQPVIEHCDAALPGQAHEKGFLSLSDEIAAIARSGTPVGLWLNWGRSAVELRDPDAVTAQIAAAAATGRLVGLSFSGAAAVDTAYGAAWADLHLPIAETDPAARSLLDVPHVADALEAAGDVHRLGVKVSRRPADRTAADVARTIADNLDALRRGWVHASGRADEAPVVPAGLRLTADEAHEPGDHGDHDDDDPDPEQELRRFDEDAQQQQGDADDEQDDGE